MRKNDFGDCGQSGLLNVMCQQIVREVLNAQWIGVMSVS